MNEFTKKFGTELNIIISDFLMNSDQVCDQLGMGNV